MYHHHHTRRSSTSQYNASRFLSHLTTHAFISPQMSILAFCTLHPFLPCTGRRCMGNSPACRMFSYSCTVWVSLPHVLLGSYSSPESTAIFLLFPLDRTLTSYLCPHRPFSFISTPSSTYHSPLRIFHVFELLPPIPSKPESTR